MAMVAKELIEAKQFLLVVLSQTLSDFMICTGMCGNGAKIGIVRIENIVCCGAARGAVPQPTVARRVAAGIHQTARTTVSAFVWLFPQAVFSFLFTFSAVVL